MAKTYRCYYGSAEDFDFVCTFLKNRDMWTRELEELEESVHIELHPYRSRGYACTTWDNYNRLMELCHMAGEYRAMAAHEDELERAGL